MFLNTQSESRPKRDSIFSFLRHFGPFGSITTAIFSENPSCSNLAKTRFLKKRIFSRFDRPPGAIFDWLLNFPEAGAMYCLIYIFFFRFYCWPYCKSSCHFNSSLLPLFFLALPLPLSYFSLLLLVQISLSSNLCTLSFVWWGHVSSSLTVFFSLHLSSSSSSSPPP